MLSLASCRIPSRSGQRGIATLLTAVVILLITTVLIIAVSRTTVMEQRMNANEVRARQAFEAAQAGIDEAIVYLTTGTVAGADKNNDNIADTLPVVTLPTGAAYAVAFCNPQNPPQNGASIDAFCPATPGAVLNNPGVGCDYLNNEANEARYLNTPLIIACGWSDDRLGRRVIRQGVGTVAAIVAPPEAPLVSRGAMNASGSANVVNYFTNLTVWAGGPLTSIGNSGKTFIRNPNVPPPPEGTPPPGPPSNCGTTANYVCPTDKNNTGPDVIENDPTLSNLTPEQLFLNFFGYTLAEYKSGVASKVIPASQASTLSGMRGQAVVIEGNTTLPNATIGSRNRPVILIVDGNLSFQGNPTVHGVVFVTGNVSGGGNPTIYGSLVTAGSVSPTGSVDIIYDPFITTGAAENTGRPGLIPGSWRDWR